ncbi:hypothetical protein Tco_0780944 [Tanacetum coccineum]
MMCKPRSYYDEVNKVAIGYKNPLCLHRARLVQPALYSGHVIVTPNHAPAVVSDGEETLELTEISRKKMHDKMKANECVDNKAYNREVHLLYLRHLNGKCVDTLREIVEEAKVERPLDRSLASACRYTKILRESIRICVAPV